MSNSNQATNSTNKNSSRSLSTILFIISYVLFLYSISNKLGKHVLKGITATGKFIPHDYYTGFTTEMPFKIVLGMISLSLLIWSLKSRFSTTKTLLLLPVLLLGLTFIGIMLVFFLFWGF